MEEKTYPPITDEQKSQIEDLFDRAYESEFEYSQNSSGYMIRIINMYNYISFKEASTLRGYMKIAEILNCTDGEEQDRMYEEGCPTCEYGSSYEVTLRFW